MDYSSIFAARAQRYRDAQVRWPDIRRAELECFATLLGVCAGERILDAPAGNGVLKGYLPSGCDYLALDPAADFVAACREQGLPVQCAPLRNSGLPDGHFDVLGSLTGLHHESRREEVYAEWWRLLKPGGRLVAMDVAVGSAVAGFLNGFVNCWNSQGHAGVFIDQADEQALRQMGFIEVRQVQCEYDWCAADATQMVGFMMDLFGLDRQPSASLMLDALAAQLDAGCRQEGYRVPWKLTALLACKPGVMPC